MIAPALRPRTAVSKLGLLRELIHANDLKDQLNAHWIWPKQQQQKFEDCRIERVYPGKNREVVIELSVDLLGADGVQQQTLFAELVGDQAATRREQIILSLQKRRRRQLSKKSSEESSVCLLPKSGMVVRAPGLDERIPGLSLLHSPQLLVEALARITGASSNQITVQKTELLGHRLGKRCIARCHYSVQGPAQHSASIVIKCYKGNNSRGKESYDNMRALQAHDFDQGQHRIPRPVAWTNDYSTLWMEAVTAGSFTELPTDQHQPALIQAGEIISKLHQTDLLLERKHRVQDELDMIENWVAIVVEVNSKLSNGVLSGLEKVRRLLNECRNADVATVHRDFYNKQVLFNQDSTVLIDFDTLCRADPALDIGNFLAHLKLIRLQGINTITAAETAFLSGYQKTRVANRQRINIKHINAWEKATLLRLVCLYSFWPRYTEICEPLLEALHSD